MPVGLVAIAAVVGLAVLFDLRDSGREHVQSRRAFWRQLAKTKAPDALLLRYADTEDPVGAAKIHLADTNIDHETACFLREALSVSL